MLKNLAKKSILVVFVAMFCSAFFPFQIKGVSAQAQDSYYAKVQSSNVKLYRSTTGSEEFSNVYFVIPQSYFVEISYCENEDYYTARYQDVYGYVKKSEVKAISGVITMHTPLIDNAGTPEEPILVYKLILFDGKNNKINEWTETMRRVRNDDRSWW